VLRVPYQKESWTCSTWVYKRDEYWFPWHFLFCCYYYHCTWPIWLSLKKDFFFQLDVQIAFLNGYLHEEVYMNLPKGCKTQQNDNSNLVCQLTRSLYGLKQAFRQWFKHFSTSLKSHGFLDNRISTTIFCIFKGYSLFT